MLGTLSSRIFYFDIAALVIQFIIVGSLFLNKKTVGSQSRLFIWFIFTVFITTIFDISRAVLPSFASKLNHGLFASYFVNTIYFLTRLAHLPLYAFYIVIASNSLNNFKRHKAYYYVCIVPYVFFIGLIIINFFTPILFSFTEDFEFVREKLMLTMYMVSVIYMVFCIAYSIHYRKLFAKRQVPALFSLIVFNLLAVTSQILFPQYLVEMFCTSVALLIIAITFHHPDGMQSTELNMMTYKTFIQEMQKSELIKRSQTIIFAGIKNFKHIYSILPYSDLHILLSNASYKINELDKKFNLRSSIYYFDNGTFAIVSSSKNDVMKKVCGELYDFFENRLTIEKLGVKIIPSFCIFNYPQDLITADEVITFGRTYQQLIPTKKSYVDISEIKEKTDFRLRNEINEIISKAINQENFEMYYQPIYNTKTGKFSSAEALIRLKDDKYGFVSPEIFIAAAERTGAIYQIGDFILDDVCKFIGSPEFKDLDLDYIEINLSVAQCLQVDLADKIKAMIRKYDISPNQINLEITERESVYDQIVFDNNMKQLTDIGINFSLDDYGTGYSNIRRIFQLPLKVVKIDKSFVDHIENPQILSIVTGTIKMLQDINKEIVVEGVEDAQASQVFINLKCDYIQGYHYSRPLNRSSFIDFIKEKNRI